MKASKLVLSALAAGFVLQACNNVDFKKTSAGIPYKVFSSAKGDSIHQNYVVKFMVIQKIADSVRYSSYKEGMPQYAQVTPLRDSLTYADISSNIMEIMPHLKNGDSLYLVQSADSMLKMNPLASSQLKKGDKIVTTVRIVEVFKTPDAARESFLKDQAAMMKAGMAKAAETDRQNLERFKKDTAAQTQVAKDNKEIEAYLASHHIQTTKTDWGVYIQVQTPGTGNKPEIGQYVNVKYKGMGLDGKVFDQGAFPMQIGAASSIKGFEEGIRQMSKGEKAIIYIPSILGYGSNGNPPKITPNENLAFELELLDISDTPPQQPQQPNNPEMDSAAKADPRNR